MGCDWFLNWVAHVWDPLLFLPEFELKALLTVFSWMVDQGEESKLYFWPWFIPWINISGFNCIRAPIQGDFEIKHARPSLCWWWKEWVEAGVFFFEKGSQGLRPLISHLLTADFVIYCLSCRSPSFIFCDPQLFFFWIVCTWGSGFFCFVLDTDSQNPFWKSSNVQSKFE